jgi:hypothetical protein
MKYLNTLLSEDETDSVSAKELSVLTLNINSLSAQVQIIKDGSNKILPYDTIVCWEDNCVSVKNNASTFRKTV